MTITLDDDEETRQCEACLVLLGLSNSNGFQESKTVTDLSLRASLARLYQAIKKGAIPLSFARILFNELVIQPCRLREKQQTLQQTLKDLMPIITEAHFTDAEIWQTREVRRLEVSMQLVYGLMWVYLLFVAAWGLAHGQTHLFHQLTAISAQASNAWNEYDGIAAFLTASIQGLAKQKEAASVNAVSATQLSILTILAHTGVVVGTVATAFSGVSFAIAMWAGWYNEHRAIGACTAKIAKLKGEQKFTDLPQDTQTKIMQLEIEREGHRIARGAWLVCAGVMSTAAILALVGLSTISFGIPIAMAGLGLLSIALRSVIADNINTYKKQRVYQAVAENCRATGTTAVITQEGLHERLQALAIDDCKSPLLQKTLPSNALIGRFWHKPSFTFKEYIEKLINHDVLKARRVIAALENQDQENLKQILGEHRNRWFFGGFGKTSGEKYVALNVSPASMAKK